MNTIQIKNLTFKPYITKETLQTTVKTIAERINADYRDQEVLFIGMLNGAFIFAADLLKHINLTCKISFVKMASYEGTTSTGEIKEIIGLNESVKGKHVIVVEDIVDTGLTIQTMYHTLQAQQPLSLEICTLILKPEKYDNSVPLKYVGHSISNEFIVGYGLDYDGYGRNIASIYQLQE
ncbi:hypoxanthine phosphoribosyltransferase [Bacteroidia bacterium]|nr:hypoxanthine phosphoribosyltransferase [Bacteroidia bacterium]